MRSIFVKTENTKRYLSALDSLQRRGASEACLIVVDGVPGLGKTETLDWWSAQNDCIYLRAKKEWTPSWMLNELLAAVNTIPEYSFQKKFKQLLTALEARLRIANENDEIFAIVIDEVDHISRSEKLLDTLRDFTDFLEVPLVLVGMGKVRHHLKRFPQIASRVHRYVEFQPASLQDISALVTDLCEIDVKPDLVELLHKSSRGLVREALEGINNIERFGMRNDGPIGVAEMAGQILMNDRRDGKPIKVKG